MRLIVDIEDADRTFVAESRNHAGQVVMIHGPGRAIVAHIIAEAVPTSVAGSGDRYKACYDVTLLGVMKG